MQRRSTRSTLAALALLCVSAPVAAQDLAIRLGGGLAAPIYTTSNDYVTGPAAMAALEAFLTPRWGLRLDVEWSRINERDDLGSGGQVQTWGASLNGVYRFPGQLARPYLLAGVGAYQLERTVFEADPYDFGITSAVQLGAGIDLDLWPGVEPFAEARAALHMTDYPHPDVGPAYIWPVVVGVRLALPD